MLNRFGRLPVNLGCERGTTGQGQGLVRKRATRLSEVWSIKEGVLVNGKVCLGRVQFERSKKRCQVWKSI